ncbi:hypothetical protein CRD82_04410 [Escherichia coli]|uniref:hypothetical protein n=1 Tax=Escherichia coli TaxID=562 RepID=UPI000E34CD2F|nr:hypothetical protein [Escherichia coli]RFQ36479.1 hypothetical protein CRD82_04410 [Escherichia coli]
MTFDELEAKGAELVEQRNKCTDEGERALLNKQIRSIRQAQIKLISDEIVETIKPRIPELVEICIKASGIDKSLEELRGGE